MEKSKDWLSKYLIWVITIISWIVVLVIKKNNPETSLQIPLIISGIFSIIAIILSVVKNIDKFKPKSEEISKLGEKDIQELILKEADRRWNNINIEKPEEWRKTKTINNDLIYAIKVNLNLEEEKFIIIINASEPKIAPTILEAQDEYGKEISNNIINQEINNKARNPKGEPNIIERETGLDQFNRPIEKVRETKYEKKEEETEEKEL